MLGKRIWLLLRKKLDWDESCRFGWANLVTVKIRAADEGCLSEYREYFLYAFSNGTRKPDSLFVEVPNS